MVADQASFCWEPETMSTRPGPPEITWSPMAISSAPPVTSFTVQAGSKALLVTSLPLRSGFLISTQR